MWQKSCLVLWFLILFLEKSYEKCDVISNGTVCDSVQDLHFGTLRGKITIAAQNLTKFTSTLPLEKAAKISHLTLRNCINGIEESAFKNFSNLHTLICINNNISEIPPRIFENSPLKFLALTSCNIKSISPGAFFNLTELDNLAINNNNLTIVRKDVFDNLTISKLSLSKNQITEIEDLRNLTKLKKLFLDSNQLRKFHWDGANQLEKLWLHNNQLTEVTSYKLEGLTNLKILNLGSNLITTIEPYSFAETPKLQLLVLTNNSLTILSGSILPSGGLPDLKNLYLDHNRLTYLSSTFFYRVNNLKGITIGGNPWQCPCLDLIFRWLHDNKVKLKCDEEYFSEKRPICVVPTVPNLCIYSYEQKYYETFQNQNSKYPPVKPCLL